MEIGALGEIDRRIRICTDEKRTATRRVCDDAQKSGCCLRRIPVPSTVGLSANRSKICTERGRGIRSERTRPEKLAERGGKSKRQNQSG